jgi:hypothetical protein
MGLTFEKVWAAMMESRAAQDRMNAETDKRIQENAQQLKESKAVYDRMIAEMKESNKESKAEHDRIIGELGKQMGSLHRSFGELADHLVAPNLVTKFREFNYTFTKSA